MSQNTTTNLGEGSIPSLLAKLAVPAVVAQVVNLMYNIVDRIYIGHISGIGASALTGVRAFYPYTDAHKCICDACRFRRSAESSDIYGKKR